MASDLLLARVCASTRHRIRRYSIIRQRNRPMTKPVEAPKGISLKEKLLFSQQKRPFQLMAVRKPAAPGDRYDLKRGAERHGERSEQKMIREVERHYDDQSAQNAPPNIRYILIAWGRSATRYARIAPAMRPSAWEKASK